MGDKRSIVLVTTLLLGFASGVVRQLVAPEQSISPLDIAFMLVGVFLVARNIETVSIIAP